MSDSSHAGKPHEHRGLLAAGSRLRHPFRRRGHQPDSNPDHVVVRLSGEITSTNAERIGKNLEEILRSQPGVLEIDLGGVTYLHGDGGTVFFMALRAARAHGTWVMVTHVGRQPLGTLNQLGLGRAPDMYEGDGPIGS
ncbi:MULTISPECIES: STAS domain-containing protein [unclassified Streptomyces]|uniref:STAS domain-containing protein n=1 Tax=unclassified Streptomyces TaxID=2593676 RepID=UPI00386A250C|nr:STAS domain-containing protein [Streptomyces sp. NBC_00827]